MDSEGLFCRSSDRSSVFLCSINLFLNYSKPPIFTLFDPLFLHIHTTWMCSTFQWMIHQLRPALIRTKKPQTLRVQSSYLHLSLFRKSYVEHMVYIQHWYETWYPRQKAEDWLNGFVLRINCFIHSWGFLKKTPNGA